MMLLALIQNIYWCHIILKYNLWPGIKSLHIVHSFCLSSEISSPSCAQILLNRLCLVFPASVPVAGRITAPPSFSNPTPWHRSPRDHHCVVLGYVHMASLGQWCFSVSIGNSLGGGSLRARNSSPLPVLYKMVNVSDKDNFISLAPRIRMNA